MDAGDRLLNQVVAAAKEVHSSLGPGLLKEVYEKALSFELSQIPIEHYQGVPIPLKYKALNVESGFRADLLVEETLIVEVRAVEKLLPLHSAQLRTFLKLGGYKTGLLLNFDVVDFDSGVLKLSI